MKPDDPDAKIKFFTEEALHGVGSFIFDAPGNRVANKLGKRDCATGEMWENKPPFSLALNNAVPDDRQCKHYTGRGVRKLHESGTALAEDMGVPVSKTPDSIEAHYQASLKTARNPNGEPYPAFASEKSWNVASGKTVAHRQVPLIQRVQKMVEVPQVQFIDKVVDIPVFNEKRPEQASKSADWPQPRATCSLRSCMYGQQVAGESDVELQAEWILAADPQLLREPRHAQSQPSKAWRQLSDLPGRCDSWRSPSEPLRRRARGFVVLWIFSPGRLCFVSQLQRHFNALRDRGFQSWQLGARVRLAVPGFPSGEAIEMMTQLIEHGAFDHDSTMVVAEDKQVLLDLAHVGFVPLRFTVLALGRRALSMATLKLDLHSPRLLCLTDTQK